MRSHGYRSVLKLWRAGLFRWLVALYCALLGALMFVTPHQFDGASYVGLRSQLPLWGLLFLLAGGSLIGTLVFAAPDALRILAHVVAAAMLICLAVGVIAVGAWLGATGYVFLAIGILVAAALPRTSLSFSPADRHLLPLVIGMSCLVSGLIVFSLPGQLASPVFDPVRNLLPLYGAGYLVGGLAVVGHQLRPFRSTVLVRGAHLLLGASMWAFVAPFVPLHVWSGIAYAGIFGGAIALQPWIGPRLRRLDPASLRTRLAVTSSAVVALALIAMVALSTNQEEQTASTGALEEQRAQAGDVAADVADMVDKEHDVLTTMSVRTDLASMSPDALHRLLQGYATSYTEVGIFAAYDLFGKGIARSDDRDPVSYAGRPIFDEVQRTHAFSIDLTDSPLLGASVVDFGAPFDNSQGKPSGVLVDVVETRQLARLVQRGSIGTDGRAYLVDGNGRLIVDTSAATDSHFADISGRPPVQAFRQLGTGDSGSLLFGNSGSETVAGFARVPGLPWGVVVERPLATVLATTRAGQDVSFLTLVVICALAAASGAWLAGRLVQPINRLGAAVTAFADDGTPVPVPETGVTEVAQLATAFADLQTRLAQRTRDRERLLEAERQARGEADAAVALRDEFLSVAAHEIRTPLTSLQLSIQLELRRLAQGTVSVEEIIATLRRIDDQARRLGRLVSQLLDISRIQSGRLAIDRTPTNLVQLVDDAVASARSRAPDSVVLLSPSEAIRADVDPLRLEQVLTNLIDNALKYGGQGGPIAVELARNGQNAVISVRDHGPGIAVTDRDRIFERFFRGHGQNHSSGMGLGLAISREIVVLHHGQIWCEFPDDGGARFVVTIPLEST
jgi:signal transduction histidine kinase